MSAVTQSSSVLVKRYGRSRFYDTTHGCYVSLEKLRAWMAVGVVFSVVDTETGAEITRALLA